MPFSCTSMVVVIITIIVIVVVVKLFENLSERYNKNNKDNNCGCYCNTYKPWSRTVCEVLQFILKMLIGHYLYFPGGQQAE